MRRPSLRLIGLTVLLIAGTIFLAGRHWLETRNFRVLYTQLYLEKAEETYSFRIEDQGNYSVLLYMPGGDPGGLDSILMKWSIFGSSGIAQGSARNIPLTTYSYIDKFYLQPGEYKLTLKIISDTKRLEGRNILLKIEGDCLLLDSFRDTYDTVVRCAICIGFVGFICLIFSFRSKPTEYQPPKGIVIAIPDRVKRFPGYGRRLKMPGFGLVAALFFAWMMMIMLVLRDAGHLISKGIWVSLNSPKPDSAAKWIEPVVVRVAVEKRKTGRYWHELSGRYYNDYDYKYHFFLNGVEVPQDELKGRLKALLIVRSDRTVYVDGDVDANFEYIARIIDTAKAAYASRIVLLPGGTHVPR